VNTEHLVKMMNEIAAFFATESGPELAPLDIATHLKKFWEPRMRAQIVAHQAQGGAGLSPLARAAVETLSQEQIPE
jgi:formate dehydrogenase subunit delta